ncbi:hypothetical protein V6N11_062712 [Hibiscus sabdariffa]|uniref:Uncharacterized protein n=1 Tax=Hibiscus sabdariffa TaxID=183260 RepID=A0ABR2PTX5_9ROSI
MAATPQEKPAHSKETCPLTAENEDYSREFEDPISLYGCGGIDTWCNRRRVGRREKPINCKRYQRFAAPWGSAI